MECGSPSLIKNAVGELQLVPCTHCENCVKRKSAQWAFRLMQELKVSTSAYFITLTYDDEHIPYTNSLRETLSKRDLQLFFKRLRKSHESTHRIKTGRGNHCRKRIIRQKGQKKYKAIKYFAVGEYGGRFKRPHYHVILFNARIECIQDAWRSKSSFRYVQQVKLKRKNKHGYRRKFVMKTTTSYKHKGFVHYGDQRGVTQASVGYCLKYILKQTKIGKHGNDDRQPVFTLTSKGLGRSYVSRAVIKYHRARGLSGMYVSFGSGEKAAMPRYYKDLIYSKDCKQRIQEESEAKNLAAIFQQLCILGLDGFNKVRIDTRRNVREYAARKLQESLIDQL